MKSDLLKKTIQALPFAFLLHNLEEAFGMGKWTKTMPSLWQNPVGTWQFAIAVALFTVLGFVLVFARKMYRTERRYALVMAGFAGMLFLNVFVPHLIFSLIFQKPAPGVFTAVLLNLPLSAWVLWRFYKNGTLGKGEIAGAIGVGAVVGIMLVFMFLKIGEIICDLH